MRKARHTFLAVLVTCLPLLAFPQKNILDAVRLTAPIVFDGKVDEPAWDGVLPIAQHQQSPNYGQPPSQQCEVFMAYDDDYLYLAGRFHLADSSNFRPTTFKRDAFDGATDYFGLVVDSYNDNENGLAFFTTPTGLRWDGTVANDGNLENDISTDWNTFWNASTVRTVDGYMAEIRVPWTSLRFQENKDGVVMGITIWWYQGALNEQVMSPLIPLNWGTMSAWKPSQMQKFRFQNVHAKKPIYLTPYLLAGYQETQELNDDETAWLQTKAPKLEAGLDLKLSLTSNLTLDLTANTDFAQVEADDQQVNLTRFSLFFPEKRQFFQERASIFGFGFENFNRLFYSRRIGINDDDDPVRIYGGARLQGRIGKTDLGFLSMQTAAPYDSLHSENFGLLRMRRQVLNPFSYVGAIASNRTDFNGNFNSVYGLDGIFRVVGDDYLTVKWAQSFSDSLKNEPLSLRPARIFLLWEKRRYDGFSYRAGFSRAGADWSPGMGFEEREDFSSIQPEFSWGKVLDETSQVLRWRLLAKGYYVRNNPTGRIETAFASLGADLETKKGEFFNVSFQPTREYVAEAFDIGDTEIPIGEYDFTQAKALYVSPFGALFGVVIDVTGGGFYDGKLLSASLSPRLNVSSHFSLEGFYQFNRGKFKERGEAFTSHIGRLKADYFLDVKFSVAAYLQYNSLEKVITPNIRLRWNPREGNDLFLVINDLVNSDRQREIPHRPFSESRAVVLKYTYTFVF